MNEGKLLSQLTRQGIIPIIRLFDENSALFAGRAILDSGFATLELTLTTPGAFNVVRQLKKEFPGTLIGFGSVFSPEEIKMGQETGGDFFVSPHFDEELLETAGKGNAFYLPGTLTPTEIGRARKFGLNAVKIFPAEPVGGINYIKSLQGPFPGMTFIPTGGINRDNISGYLKLRNVAVGVTSLVNRADAEAGNSEETKKTVQSYWELTTA